MKTSDITLIIFVAAMASFVASIFVENWLSFSMIAVNLQLAAQFLNSRK